MRKGLTASLKIPDGYVNLDRFGYGGVFTTYYANAEGKVISLYLGTKIKARYAKVYIHKRDKQPYVRLQKLSNLGNGYPVLLSTIKSLVTTGKASIRGKHL